LRAKVQPTKWLGKTFDKLPVKKDHPLFGDVSSARGVVH